MTTKKKRFNMNYPKTILVGIAGLGKISWVDWLRVMRHRAESLNGLVKANPHVFEGNDFEDFLRDSDTGTPIWDTITPYPIEDLFKVDSRDENVSHWMFQTIGPKEIFKYFQKENKVQKLGEEQVTSKGVDGPYKETYSLYTIRSNKIPINNGTLAVVECKCPSTGNEHYLYCSTEGEHITKQDPLIALASLVFSPVPVKDLKEIYRQGEQYVFIVDGKYEVPKESVGHRLTKAEYLRLISIQS
jgi:hypothetical protein